MEHVFLVGSKSIGNYGGYETFVRKLLEYHENITNIKYYVACKENGEGSFTPTNIKVINDSEYIYRNALCFKIHIPNFIGKIQAIYYDCASLKKTIQIIEKEKIKNPKVYIMTCRIGPFYRKYVKKIHKYDGIIFLNPDGHEWKRKKWNYFIRKYWKLSEKIMVKNSDVIVCDSLNIEKYIRAQYKIDNTIYLSYGSETRQSKCSNKEIEEWLKEKNIKKKNYYLVVCRFVPENNIETIVREFIRSKTNRDLVLITNDNEKLYSAINKKCDFINDKRIKFVGSVYNQELLLKIRELAHAYIHGHEVGGTNPSLLEALGSTRINMLYDVCFNKEVGNNGALYWNKNSGNLSSLINKVDKYSENESNELSAIAKNIIKTRYSWEIISKQYEELFTRGKFSK